jgi:hypothetical protein
LVFGLKVEVILVNEIYTTKQKLLFFLSGFPIFISRLLDTNAHLLHIGDAILNINNEDITDLTHDQVINKLRDASGDRVNLTVKYMNNIAAYLHLTEPKFRSSVPVVQSSLTIRRRCLTKNTQDQKRRSAEYPSEYQNHTKQQRWSLIGSDQQKVRKLN